jgi:LemA protein
VEVSAEGVAGLEAASEALAVDEAAAAVAERAGKSAMQNAKCKMQRAKAFNMTRQMRLVSMALLLVAAAMSSGCSYNTFVSKEEGIKAQWAQVENQLQRRNDLIPNLVETTKGIAQQEKDVFGQIADSRAKMAGAKTPQDTIQAANEQSAALGRLLVVVENYPQLRSSESFNRLMDELSGTENRIAVERMRYNERVQDYNITRRRFPSNITAGIFGFKEYPLFNAPPAAEQVPKVNFGKGTN